MAKFRLLILCALIGINPALAGEVKKYQLNGGIEISIEEAPFDATKHEIEYCEIPNFPCKIDGLFPYGTAFALPQTYLERMTLTFKGIEHELDTSGMYNAWGSRPLEYEGKIRYLGAHCYEYQACTLRGIFSDAAGSFVAEWKIENGESRRTILTSSEDVLFMFIKNIDPPHYE